MCRSPARSSLAAIAIVSVVVSACGAGPTKRYVDGKWRVSENVCSTDPAADPERGDIRSEIRTFTDNSTRIEREIKVTYLDRTVVKLTTLATTGGVSGTVQRFENSAANGVAQTLQGGNVTEANRHFKAGIRTFFENDADVDAEKADSPCLYRGQL